MRVGILLDKIRTQHWRTGRGRYTLNLLKHLAFMENVEVYPISSDGQIEGDFPWKANIAILSKDDALSRLYKLLRYPYEIRRLKLDVIHCPGGFPPRYFPFAGGSKLVTVHGITPFISNHDVSCKPSFPKQMAIEIFKRVVNQFVTVSHATKQALVEQCRFPEKKIEVIYHGVEHETFRPCSAQKIAEVRNRYALRSPYILHVSNCAPIKNTVRIVEAFTKVFDEGFRDLKLAMAGGGGWRYEEFLRWVNTHRLKKNITFLGMVSDEWLPALYTGAELFVLPSLLESFGLPVLEAMACGTPVVTSDISSIREVAGDAAIFVDPKSVEAIANAMLVFLRDKQVRNELRDRGLEHVKKFSWEKCAMRHFYLYKAICTGR